MPTRKISTIGKDIERHWPDASFGARPYLHAMRHLHTASDMFGLASAKTVINCFLVKADAFEGEDAQRLKDELKELLRQ